MALDLSRIGRKSFVSQAGIAEILKAVKEAGELPKGISKSAVKRSRQAAIAAETPHGPLLREWTLTTEEGKEEKVHYLDPIACLWHALQTCSKFRQFFSAAAAASPCSVHSPWRVVVYADEVTPGNQLKPTNKRKLQTFYWSLLELGPRALQSEDGWFVLTTVRSATVASFRDKLTQLCKFCLRCFTEPGRNFSHGLNLTWPGRDDFVLVANVSILLGDEAALKQMLEFKGASGKVLCFLCRNCLQKRYAPDPLHPKTILHTCTDESKFLMHSKASLQKTVMHLEQKKRELNKGEFDELETNLGLNLCPNGVLCDPTVMQAFDPTVATMFDWMHIYLVHGLWHLEVNELVDRLQAEAKVKQQDLHERFQCFSWPSYLKDKGAAVSDFFSKKKSGDSRLNSSASEALSTYPVLRLVLQDLREARDLNQPVRDAINCYIYLCQVLDLLQKVATGSVQANELRRATKAHLDCFLITYPEASFLPKAHLALHLAMQMEKHGCLLNCFVHERRHKELKRYANQQMSSQKGSEKGLLQEVFLTHIEALDRDDLVPAVGLQAPREATKQLHECFCQHFSLPAAPGLMTSSSVTVPRWRLIKTDDVVLVGGASEGAAVVLFHCSFHGLLISCLSFLEKTDKPNTFLKAAQANVVFVETMNILGPCIHRAEGDKVVVVPQDFAKLEN